MNILRLSTLSLTLAIAVFALGYAAPSFAHKTGEQHNHGGGGGDPNEDEIFGLNFEPRGQLTGPGLLTNQGQSGEPGAPGAVDYTVRASAPGCNDYDLPPRDWFVTGTRTIVKKSQFFTIDDPGLVIDIVNAVGSTTVWNGCFGETMLDTGSLRLILYQLGSGKQLSCELEFVWEFNFAQSGSDVEFYTLESVGRIPVRLVGTDSGQRICDKRNLASLIVEGSFDISQSVTANGNTVKSYIDTLWLDFWLAFCRGGNCAPL